MACGTPVVSSNSSSLPEVVGDAGLLVNPTDTAALHASLHRILSDTELRTALIDRGLAQAKKFSWAKAAVELENVYHSLKKE